MSAADLRAQLARGYQLGSFGRAQFAEMLAALASAVEAESRIDIESMLTACIPGGTSCDPQRVADDIRSWFENREEKGGEA